MRPPRPFGKPSYITDSTCCRTTRSALPAALANRTSSSLQAQRAMVRGVLLPLVLLMSVGALGERRAAVRAHAAAVVRDAVQWTKRPLPLTAPRRLARCPGCLPCTSGQCRSPWAATTVKSDMRPSFQSPLHLLYLASHLQHLHCMPIRAAGDTREPRATAPPTPPPPFVSRP